MRLNRLLPLSLFLVGCATPSQDVSRARPAFPVDAMVVQRAVLKARGKEFTLNGYLSMSATGGKRLIILENFGGVLADVLVKPDRSIHVMRSSAAFRPAWINRFVAADLECIFGDSAGKKCDLNILSPTHFMVKRFWYTLDLRIVEIKPGPQPVETFDETKAAR